MTPPRVALLTIGDGRDDLLDATIDSLEAATGSPAWATRVHVDDRRHLLGFGGAIREGWRRLRDLHASTAGGFDYVLHVEEDWQFDRPVPLAAMAGLLDLMPTLAQVALLRGAVNDDERRAGGLVEKWPDEYTRGSVNVLGVGDYSYLEHGLYFTTNPCLYRVDLTRRLWPDVQGSEAAFTRELLAAGYHFACMGSGEPWVTHTGAIRTGVGY